MSINPPIDWYPEEIVAMTPPQRITMSEHAAKYRVLGRHSAIKGQYRLDMVPALVPIMDAISDPNTDEVGIGKSAQYGVTDAALVNTVCFYVDQEPSPIMCVLADQDSAEYVNEEKIQVAFEESPHLRRLYDPKKFNKEEITFPNTARVDISWASSVSRLGTKTCRITIGDEIDKPGWNKTSSEAGAMSLLRERAESYPVGLRKHIWLSTPTTVTGNITVLMDSFDIIFDWHVPCPHCGQFQPLRFSKKYQYGFKDGLYRGDDGEMHQIGQVVWEGGRDATPQQVSDTARYCCGECGALWITAEKNEAIRNGKAVPRTEPTGHDRRKFFHLNRIISLFDGGRLEILVQKWIDIFKLTGIEHRKELQGFINSTLGEPFEEIIGKERRVDEILVLKDDRPAGLVPSWALVVLITADVQKDGVWYEIRAWNDDNTSALVRYGFLANTPVGADGIAGDLAALKSLAESSYFTAEKEEFAVRLGLLDSGYRTAEVYEFCKKNPVFIPSKGEQVKKIPISYTKIDTFPGSGKPIKDGLWLVSLDTNYWKDALALRLQVNISDPGAWILHSETGLDYGQHYTAEIKNQETGLWEQRGHQPNHLWDAGVLQLVSVKILENRGMMQQLAKQREQKRLEAAQSPVRNQQQQPQKSRLW